MSNGRRDVATGRASCPQIPAVVRNRSGEAGGEAVREVSSDTRPFGAAPRRLARTVGLRRSSSAASARAPGARRLRQGARQRSRPCARRRAHAGKATVARALIVDSVALNVLACARPSGSRAWCARGSRRVPLYDVSQAPRRSPVTGAREGGGGSAHSAHRDRREGLRARARSPVTSPAVPVSQSLANQPEPLRKAKAGQGDPRLRVRGDSCPRDVEDDQVALHVLQLRHRRRRKASRHGRSGVSVRAATSARGPQPARSSSIRAAVASTWRASAASASRRA